MSNALSIASVIEANRLSSDIPFLCLVDIEIIDPTTGVVITELNVARNPEDVTFNGKVYVAGQFDIQIKSEAGKFSEVTLTVNDFTRTIQSLMEPYGGGVGSNVTFYLVNGVNLAAGPEVAEYFQIIRASSSEYTQNFTLGAENSLFQTFPRRRQTKDFCQWRYKSEQCGYTGPLPSCDLSLQGPNGCEAHANSLRFGAFPGLNSNGYRYA